MFHCRHLQHKFPDMLVDVPLHSFSTSTATGTVLVAMSAEEISLFFGEPQRLLTIGDNFQILADQDLQEDSWEEVLQTANPSILLAAWKAKPLPPRYLASQACALNYVCYAAGSVRHLIPRSFLENGGMVTNWGNLVAASVAEHALLLALAALRNMGNWRKAISESHTIRRPSQFLQTRTLRGKSVGLHGYGSIARALVKLLKPFNVTIRSYSAGVPRHIMAQDGVVACDSLADLFSSSEILFECEALRPETQGSVSERELAYLAENAVFVNVGRGLVVDEQALIAHAQKQKTRIALDVVVREPITSGSPFFGIESTILSPHIGGPAADEYRECGDFALQNIKLYQLGLPLQGVVTLDTYDRAT